MSAPSSTTTTAAQAFPGPGSESTLGPRTGLPGLGSNSGGFLRAAAAAGTTKLSTELAHIVALEAAWGREALVAALERASAFRRFRAGDVRSILEAGAGVPSVGGEGEALALDLPAVAVRPLSDYRIEALA